MLQFRGSCYSSLALAFGCGHSYRRFAKLLCPFVRHLSEKWGYRILPYLDDFHVATAPQRRVRTEADCTRAHQRLNKLFCPLGRARHPDNGCWSGGTTLEHLGVTIDK